MRNNVFETWRTVPPRERGRQLLRIADCLENRLEELAKIIASETGNVLRTQARPEAKISKAPWDYFKVPGKVPSVEAISPVSESQCKLMKPCAPASDQDLINSAQEKTECRL